MSAVPQSTQPLRLAGGTPRAAALEARAVEAEARLRLERAKVQRQIVRSAGRAVLMGDYAGARRTRLRQGGAPRSTAPDAQLDLRTLESLRAESQRAVRNMPLARAVVRRTVDMVVGCGPRLQCKTADKAWNERAERWFERWSEAATADARGLWTFGQLTWLAVHNMVVDGDVGAVLVRGGGRGPYDVGRLQLIEGVRIGGTAFAGQGVNGTGKDGALVSGIRLDAAGRPTHYLVHDFNAAGTTDGAKVAEVEAENFLFLAAPQRAGQTRGEPRLAAVVPLLEKIDQYVQASVVAAQVGASQSLWIKKNNPGAAQAAGLGDTVVREDGQSERYTEMQAGAVWWLETNEEIGQIKPEQPVTQFDAFVRMLLRLAGNDMDMPLEAALLDFSMSTAYAGRTGFKVMQKSIDRLRGVIGDRWATPAARFAIGSAVRVGALPFRDDWDAFTWQWPAELTFEPDKEVAASVMAINHNLTTKRAVIEARGGDLDEVLAQRSAERAAEQAMNVAPIEAPGTKAVGTPAAE